MAKVEWEPRGLKRWNRKLVRGVPGIRESTLEGASEIVERAEPELQARHERNNPHRGLGESMSSLEVTRGTVDAFAALVDEDGGAMAIEHRLRILRGDWYS